MTNTEVFLIGLNVVSLVLFWVHAYGVRRLSDIAESLIEMHRDVRRERDELQSRLDRVLRAAGGNDMEDGE